MTTAELRQLFLDFFKDRDHQVVASSPLVPADDPTLLFTNAGMVQFKDVFLGHEQRPYKRAASSQRCVRAGGKHNDLENVGFTARHHTFFEMLGNFSFGDYFKREAIAYAWEFLTAELKLPEEKLWVTVFEEDDEAADIWLNEIRIDKARFSRIGAHDNFWSMGDTGPCGPCSEIFYDHGADVPGGPPGTPEADGDRYVEIWNLVFMQFNRDTSGTLTPLPKPSVDTGMGLERLAAVMQGVKNNFDIDLFKNLVKAVAKLANSKDLANNSLRVIADHIRACAFLIADGVMPSNEGRGYVLRRIIRRAIRHGHTLGIEQAFFYKLVPPLITEMGTAYPELVAAKDQVMELLQQEEERFRETLDEGLKILKQDIETISDNIIPGETVFKLYDTFGFPVDLTADYALTLGLKLDMDGFEKAMEKQRERARAASQFGIDYNADIQVDGETGFTGYNSLSGDSIIVALYHDGQAVEALKSGQQGIVILDQTPFYAESGGQVGDKGVLKTGKAVFKVLDTRKQAGKVFLHHGQLDTGELSVGEKVTAEVDQAARQATALNHTATHLMHAALRQVLGDHVTQKGSLVDPDRLRFDFSHFQVVTPEELGQIEHLVNEQIRLNNGVATRVMSYDDAVASGAMALFGEKYGDEVRVLSIGDFSTELCGGTHAHHAGDIGLFKIISETGVASGVRRIEAVTGQNALDWVDAGEKALQKIADLVKAERTNIEDKVQLLYERGRSLEKELEQLKAKLASSAGSELAAQAVDVGGVKVLAACLDGVDPKSLRDTVDQLKNKLGTAVVVLATVAGDKVSLVAGVTADCTDKLKAGVVINEVAQQVGGKGGGRPDMAQAGGNNPAALDKALAGVADWVKSQLG